jgi:hypothetical protein
VKLEIDIPDDRLADILCSGIEGGNCGIHYWAAGDCSFSNIAINREGRRLHGPMVPYLQPVLHAAGWIAVTDGCSEPAQTHRLTHARLAQGVARAFGGNYPRLAMALAGGDYDASAGDALIQLSLFGELRYG